MICECIPTTRKREFDVVVTVEKVNAKKDIITFLHRGMEKTGINSAWIGAKKRILKRGDRIRAHVCNWGHGEWNPAWSCEGDASIWRLAEKAKEIIKKEKIKKKGGDYVSF